jgi:hypothetical protein
MSNLKNIGNKLFKETTELKSQEVELGAADDLAKLTKEFTTFVNKNKSVLKEVQKALNLIEEAKKINDKGYDLSNKPGSTVRDVIKQAQDLGLKPQDVPALKKYSSASSELSSFNSGLLRLLPR